MSYGSIPPPERSQQHTEKTEMTAMLETKNEVFVENYLFGIA